MSDTLLPKIFRDVVSRLDHVFNGTVQIRKVGKNNTQAVRHNPLMNKEHCRHRAGEKTERRR
ncbi:MAG: hypothetical protein FVQ79_11025 [Planctomycetes bacterium]|nr:hypothetical protein [Planctomycetota bacterium]